MGLFENAFGNKHAWRAEIGQGGGAVFSPKFLRGDYDHRKAQKGQNAFGAGGRRTVTDVDEATGVDVGPIEDRIASYRKVSIDRPKPNTVRRLGLLAAVAAAIRSWTRHH